MNATWHPPSPPGCRRQWKYLRERHGRAGTRGGTSRRRWAFCGYAFDGCSTRPRRPQI